MYDSFINNEVVVIVSSRGEALWEYTGLLCDVDGNSLKLKNVEINQAMLSFQKNVFGNSIGSYKQNIEEIVLNKDYVISCYKK